MPSKPREAEFGLQRALDQDLLATLACCNCLEMEFALLQHLTARPENEFWSRMATQAGANR